MVALRRVTLFAVLCSLPAFAHAQVPCSAAELARKIDEAIAKKIEEKSLPLSPATTDAEFLRRVSLDIAGIVPTPERARAFFADTRPDRRARLIDELLASPEYARQMTDLWRELLIPQTAEALRRDQIPFVLWLRKSFAQNKPLDKLFSEVVSASGMQDQNPATTFYIVHESVDMLADRVSRSLLGIQLQCAQCHDHPFADWKQKEYWAFAGFFGKVGRLYERTPPSKERYGASENVKKTLMVPESRKAVKPQFLRGEAPELDPAKPYLPVLAKWLTAPENPYFARAMANRIWYHYFGRGIVHPVDNLIPANEPTHPELLDLLAKELVASSFDAQHLMRAICLSATYQRSSRPVAGNEEDRTLYSRMPMRVMLPFQFCDSWNRVLAGSDGERSATNDDPAIEKKIFGSRNGFANFFAPEEGSLPTEYKAGIPQALRLMNSKDTQKIYRAVSYLTKQSNGARDLIDRMYLTTLTRLPSDDEVRGLTKLFGGVAPNEAAVDIMWALLNSTEFFTNH